MRLQPSSMRRFFGRSLHNLPKPVSKRVKIGQTEIKFECGRLARFADGAALVQMGDTSVGIGLQDLFNISSKNYRNVEQAEKSQP